MPRPNILLITTDRQRGDCLGLNDHPALETPNLDHLGERGVNFTNAYTECPSCVPARRILLTGCNQVTCGLVGYRDGLDWDAPVSVAAELGRAGYQTELVGKLHQHPLRKRHGFDHMAKADDLGEREPNDYTDYLRRSGYDEPRAWMGHGVEANCRVARPWHLPERMTHSYWCANQTIDFLERRDPSCPFFCHLSFLRPHMPLTPPEHHLRRYLDEAESFPAQLTGDWDPDPGEAPSRSLRMGPCRLSERNRRLALAGYFGLISEVDDMIGRVVAALVRMKLLEETFILFTSDHGEMLGDHNLWGITYPYEPVLKVPFLAAGPRSMGLAGGSTVAAPIGLQDIAPTLLDVAGVEPPPAMDGRSLLPWLRGDSPAWRPWLHAEHSASYDPTNGWQGLTDGREKYVWETQTGRELLFDLVADPGESRNLAAVDADRTAAWRERLIATLADRPEGFVAAGRLVAGRPHQAVIPTATN